ncbi:calmodulin-binding protein 60 A-like isoform X2 [Cornus florida]|uniref:calmodulin-binding protein 60 A-like isoform X2 n=1 Tax=Cornus florida TaxID=4283 RepID=UPI00289B526F|nr:calmodulin-binding protein 60 A-like isoform X2 [Cornus florida]
MGLNQQLEDDNAVSELKNDGLIEKKLELIVIRTVRQLIGPILEPLIRKVVKEEIESAQETILTSLKRNEIHPSESKILQLCFLDKLSLPVLTGIRIQGEKGTSIKVALVDGFTKEIINCGPEASAKVEIVVIEGDFDDDEGHDWTIEEFNQKIIRERKGKKSLLIGNPYLNMKEGIGTLGGISFTHNSIWMKNGEFRLAARVEDNFGGTRVREAISEPFVLKDRRSSLYGKHDTPSLLDEVWRLKKIRKDGPFHKLLSKENITTVKDFLTLFFINRQRLYDILVAGTKNAGTKMVEIMIDHARTCKLDETVHLYRSSSQQEIGLVFNVVGQLMGLLLECEYIPIDMLSETEKDVDVNEGLLFLNNDHNPQPENLAVELPAAEQRATSGSQIRWLKLFSVLQWVKIRSIVRSNHSNHVQKKQRCC